MSDIEKNFTIIAKSDGNFKLNIDYNCAWGNASLAEIIGNIVEEIYDMKKQAEEENHE